MNITKISCFANWSYSHLQIISLFLIVRFHTKRNIVVVEKWSTEVINVFNSRIPRQLVNCYETLVLDLDEHAVYKKTVFPNANISIVVIIRNYNMERKVCIWNLIARLIEGTHLYAWAENIISVNFFDMALKNSIVITWKVNHGKLGINLELYW